MTRGRQISASRRSLAGAAQLAFDESSTSIQLSVSKSDAASVSSLLAARQDAKRLVGGQVSGSVMLVFDGALLSKQGGQGGYFYSLYLNMPSVIDSQTAQNQSYIGAFGAFRIAGAAHHGAAMVEYDISDLLLNQGVTDLSGLTLSWIRVDGDNPPSGKTISVNEMRIELSSESQIITPQGPTGPKGWYR